MNNNNPFAVCHAIFNFSIPPLIPWYILTLLYVIYQVSNVVSSDWATVELNSALLAVRFISYGNEGDRVNVLKWRLHPVQTQVKLSGRGHILIATTSPKSSSHLHQLTSTCQRSGRVTECMREKGSYHWAAPRALARIIVDRIAGSDQFRGGGACRSSHP